MTASTRLQRATAVGTLAALLAVSTPANSTVLDFSAVQGNRGPSLTLPEVTITAAIGGSVLVGTSVVPGGDGFCFLRGGFCESDGEMLFTDPIQNLSFDVDGASFGDYVEISAFDGATLLGSVIAVSEGNLDFSGFGVITRLYFDDSSTSQGVAYSTFTFDLAPPQNAPAPATLPMVLGALGLGALLRRRSSPRRA